MHTVPARGNLSLDCGGHGAGQDDQYPPSNDEDGGAAALDTGNCRAAQDQQDDHPDGEDVSRGKQGAQPLGDIGGEIPADIGAHGIAYVELVRADPREDGDGRE